MSAITIHQSNLTKSLKISWPQLFPRACTSIPPSESPPSLIGEKPRFSASAPISAAAATRVRPDEFWNSTGPFTEEMRKAFRLVR